MTIQISMRRYGCYGWIWTVNDTDTDEMQEYRTDEQGFGLWHWQPTEASLRGYDPMPIPQMEWARIKSRYDYQLPHRRGSAWAKIRREYGKEH